MCERLPVTKSYVEELCVCLNGVMYEGETVVCARVVCVRKLQNSDV